MKQITFSKQSVRVFFAAVIPLSAAAELLICRFGCLWAYPLLMWMPALAALLASVAALRDAGERVSPKGLLAALSFRRCGIGYLLAGVLLPLAYLLPPYLIYWRMYPENFAYNGVALGLILRDCLPAAIIGTLLGLLTAAGEEIGWRGFLVPALRERQGLNKMLLITGLFWCLWHYPLLIWGGYAEGQPLLLSLLTFTLCIFPVGVICALLRLESGSLWPCALLHAAHNNYDQAIFDVITRGADKTSYVGETGIYTILCVWVVDIVMVIRFRRKEST